MIRAIADYEMLGEDLESAPWLKSRRWTDEARQAQRERMKAARPTMTCTGPPPEPFARAQHAELAAALNAFLAPAEDLPLPKGVPFVCLHF